MATGATASDAAKLVDFWAFVWHAEALEQKAEGKRGLSISEIAPSESLELGRELAREGCAFLGRL